MRDLAAHDDLFPIRDAASATLMAAKAKRLHAAGVIGAAEREQVLRRAEPYLGKSRKMPRGTPAKPTTAELLLT